ncbi:helix-turn-helix domain-containing protein [Lysobacter sp. 5GHs7-4]|uniref:AraC family transcriptional regulator n=1 Tax=Lysobacter sp. 5GHs7-4 TaxID=2904253 RepID=UPI001E5711DB|nr:helix-turn-helix domain-containing protein [Lysobacter sp. 5GHs7-4]UHQ24116.1 helix-turn-helix domain-containing protein [Lysobacter sp. 5GHs7-4]
MRAPPALQPWVAQVWACARPDAPSAHAREHSLPSGAMHLAIRLDGPPLRIYADADDRQGRDYAMATVGGVRAGYCIKDTAHPAASVGAVLRPGAALALFGVSAAELSERHFDLSDVCGRDEAERLCERLAARSDDGYRAGVLLAFLDARLRRARRRRGLDPQILHALEHVRRAPADADMAALADACGRSQRRFIAGFRDLAGLAPKRYARVLRFQRLLAALAATPRPVWAQLALDQGYFDQSHLIREFREFAGVSPREYLRCAPASPNHLPVKQALSL